ncbi:MAG: transcription elongation factor GreA [Anaerolineales bacterium]|nr:transcription elongation factor GreA [Anaerolineales bacterium]
MDKREIFLTPQGAERLRAELEELRGPRRLELAARLRHAVQQGDLSENADYIIAKEEQGFLEGRIQELESVLRLAIIADGPREQGVVTVGSTVVVAEGDSPPETYQVVGVKEADPASGRISHESPFGAALMGRHAGETVPAATPAGEVLLRILEVR